MLIDPGIAAYVAAHTAAPDAVLAALRDRTAALGGVAQMQISADQGALLTLLTRVAGARQADRGGNVHRLLVDLHRPGSGSPAAGCSAAT